MERTESAGPIAPRAAPPESADVNEVADVLNGANGEPEITTLIAQGAGRRKIAKELNNSEYEAHKLISFSRNGER